MNTSLTSDLITGLWWDWSFLLVETETNIIGKQRANAHYSQIETICDMANTRLCDNVPTDSILNSQKDEHGFPQ